MNGYLIDENMPQRIPVAFNLPVVHVRALGPSVPDSIVWEHAAKNAMVIVSKEADFSDRIMLSSPPPWVVRFRIGNMRKAALLEFVSKVWPRIDQLLPKHKLINVYPDRIEAVE